MTIPIKERPIIFSGPMVLAIPDARKTQTRRVIVPQPLFLADGGCWYPECGPRRAKHYANEAHLRKGLTTDFSPYGQPGDRLWVRETHYRWGRYIKSGQTPAGLPRWRFYPISVGGIYPNVHYLGDERITPATVRTKLGWHKRPAIFMPRWASRLTLENQRIRVERVQEISEEDAIAEGVEMEQCASTVDAWASMGLSNPRPSSHREGFINLWDSINAKRGFGWDVNPWVRIIEFSPVPNQGNDVETSDRTQQIAKIL